MASAAFVPSPGCRAVTSPLGRQSSALNLASYTYKMETSSGLEPLNSRVCLLRQFKLP